MKYLITGKSGATVKLTYSEDGLISALEFKENTATQSNWMLSNVPVLEELLINFCKTKKLRLDPIAEDTSFQAFWNAFKYKVGKKARAERLWNGMSEIEQQIALAVIPRYHRFAAFKNQESAYPETWLNNRMWENEYTLK